MKASQLIAALAECVSKHGDMDILVRSPEDPCEWTDITVWADPPSEMEREDGISGTIDITLCGGHDKEVNEVGDLVGLLANYCDGLMCRIMEDQDIPTGDIYPEQAFELEHHIDGVAGILMEVLNQNRRGNK